MNICPLFSNNQELLSKLSQHQNYTSKRISSFDRTGENKDRLTIKPGETAVLAEIKGPAAIHHMWVTISAESFYGRKIILRMHWDGEEKPSLHGTGSEDYFFDAPDMTYLQTIYPPEKETDLKKKYNGKGNLKIKWKKIHAEKNE